MSVLQRIAWTAFLVAAVDVLNGCGEQIATNRSAVMVDAGAASTWVIYRTHGLFARMNGIVATSDGNIWLSARGGFVRITPRSATYSTFSSGPVDPESLTVGADGRVYATGCCTLTGEFAVLAVTAQGRVSRYVPHSHDGINDGVVLGPDGNVWFAEERHVGKITPGGKITEYPIQLPSGDIANDGYGIGSVAGKVWFPIWNEEVSPYHGYIVGVDPKNGQMTQTRVPCFDPAPVVGAAGAVWAGCPVRPFDPKVNLLQMTPDGSSTIYRDRDWLGFTGAQALIATQKRLWFITDPAGRHPNRVGAFNLATHHVTDYIFPTVLGTCGGLTPASGARVWVHCFDSGYPAAGEFLGSE